MTDEWKDRIIRGGTIVMGTVAGLGCVGALISTILGIPAAGRAGFVMLLAAAGIGLACVIAVTVRFPWRPTGEPCSRRHNSRN